MPYQSASLWVAGDATGARELQEAPPPPVSGVSADAPDEPDEPEAADVESRGGHAEYLAYGEVERLMPKVGPAGFTVSTGGESA